MFDFSKIFGGSNDNPLLDSKEISRILASLANSDSVSALDELGHWLELLSKTEEIKLKPRFNLAVRLNLAAQPHIRKLLTEYVQASRMNKSREDNVWNVCSYFHNAVYDVHMRCIADGLARSRKSIIDDEVVTSGVRAMRAVGMLAHWTHLRYRNPLPANIWDMMYTLFNMAEQRQFCRTGVALNPQMPEQKTSLLMEMAKILMMEVSAPDRLTKSQMDLARQIIDEFAPAFVWEDIPAGETVFFIDFSLRKPPVRLTRMTNPHFMSRCFGPGSAVPALVNAVKQLESGAIPRDVDIRRYADFRREDLLEVFLHLSQAWSKLSPQDDRSHFDKRKFARNKIFSHVEVVHGLDDIHKTLLTFKAHPEKLPQEMLIDKLANDELVYDITSNKILPTSGVGPLAGVGIEGEETVSTEIWVAENVSETGYGLTIPEIKQDWVQTKELVGFRKEHAPWSFGIIRRVEADAKANTRVGIVTLSRAPEAVSIAPVQAELTVWESLGETFSMQHTLALLLQADPPLLNENSLILPQGGYDLHKTYELSTYTSRKLIRLDFVRESFYKAELVTFSVLNHQNK